MVDIAIVTVLLAAAVYLLISERIPIDLTAIGLMAALALTGLLEPVEAAAGLANPAVVTVGAMFLVSQALVRTGAISFIGPWAARMVKGRPRLALVLICLLVGVASAFVNNTPVVVLFIPVIISMGCQLGVSPSQYLIPASYASILAGTCTLIGTSTNIIVSDLSASYGHGTLSMFELAKVGLPLAVLGLLFMILVAPRLMPRVNNSVCELEDETRRRYLAQAIVTPESWLIDSDPCPGLAELHPGIEVVELVRRSRIFHPCRDRTAAKVGDVLLVKGSADALVQLMQDKGLEPPLAETPLDFGGPNQPLAVELIIPPQSGLQGLRLEDTELLRNDYLTVLAVERSGLSYSEKELAHIRLKTGDVLLVWVQADKMDRLRNRADWIVAEDVQTQIVNKRRAGAAGAIFIALVAAASLGLADIMICALAAVFLLALTGCLSLRRAYRALQPEVLLLIAATIALGAAMTKTGASRYYAELSLSLMKDWPPGLILGGFVALTSVSTQLLSNNATAVLLLPIAVSSAQALGVDPKPFIMAVCYGASACFATPIGYQTNLLVYGPGGYRFSDYLKMGIPLNLLVVVGATLLIPVFWPF